MRRDRSFMAAALVSLWLQASSDCWAGVDTRFDPQVAPIQSFASLAAFPFAGYAATIGQTDIATHERYRNFLNGRQAWLGDKFIYKAFDHYNHRNHLSLTSLDATVSTGETLLGNGGPYRVAGYYILGQAAQFITTEVERGRIDPKSQQFQAIKARLRQNRIVIAPRQGSLDKAVTHATKCAKLEWESCSYLGQRGEDMAKDAVGRVRRTVSERAADLSQSVPWLPTFGLDKMGEQLPPIQLSDFLRMNSVNGGYASHYMTLTRDGIPIGTAVWLKRPEIKATYLAVAKTNAMKRRLSELGRSGARTVLRTTGGFSNSEHLPDGFTADGGKIVNPVILPDMDGLALIQQDGGIRLINLKDPDVTLPGITAGLNLKRSLADFATFLDWVELNRATVFQSQLLAYSNKLLIDSRLTPPQMRERRILALARAQDRTLYHVVFDIPQSSNLAAIAADLFTILAHRKMKIEGMINLDVGAYNILECFDEQEQQMPSPKGPLPSARATNLLVYFIQ